MKRFYWKIFWCLLPMVLASLVVARAYYLWDKGLGGFKLGVDLVGGTILVYEVDDPSRLPENYKPEELAASLKRRIDPADLHNVTIRPIGRTRVEIILPTGGLHQAEVEQAAWKTLLDQVKEKWPVPEGENLSVGRGQIEELITRVSKQHPEVSLEDIRSFIQDNYKATGQQHLTEEEVDRVKGLIKQVGSLEFRILANSRDDAEAIKKAEESFPDTKNETEAKKLRLELDRLAHEGKPPPPPAPPPGRSTFDLGERGQVTYSWVELDKEERHALGLDNAAENDSSRNSLWKAVAEARDKYKPFSIPRGLGGDLLFSRKCEDFKLISSGEAARKKYEYFVLTRNPEKDSDGVPKAVTGQYLINAQSGQDAKGTGLAVHFRFDSKGGELFYDLTSKNRPEESGGSQFSRFLAILLDDKIVSAPTINEAIRSEGMISGNFTKEKVDNLVTILRSGALPATLKPTPVSENTMGATLGEDTIFRGTVSVAIAFVAILVFMLVYYRFAGLVACVALLANLLLTVGFMVAVNATFTLPGLAGLVLMLGMAVDANVLIYERLREERDRGASLALALRNGYDRAFPTIIDTHLSSMFTAIVLYAVGNDQLKGFGISLTVGLGISLFTSLLMTRLMFDIWQLKGWLHKLSMFRLFSRPSIDFMAIRYYWFFGTIVATIIGATVFIYRLDRGGLNIDFMGGTLYGGQLTKAVDIETLRGYFTEERQKERLRVTDVKQRDSEGPSFDITYDDKTTRKIDFPNPTTVEDVKKRAQELPDYSVDQIFLSSFTEGDKSPFFTLRTAEKAPELVQASLDRLLADPEEPSGSLLKKIGMKFTLDNSNKGATLSALAASTAGLMGSPSGQGPLLVVPALPPGRSKGADLEFTDYASPAQVTLLLQRELKDHGLAAQASQFGLSPQGEDKDGRVKKMRLELTEPVDRAKLEASLKATENEFARRPQPDRLEVFDKQLAQDTQLRAMYAILASWGAILLYLWFRFGNWTFGLAAVLCLIHDLFFTLGIIAFCHYLHGSSFGNLLALQDFKIDLPAVAALLTLVGYSVNDTIVVFDRIREVRGKNPLLTPQTINDSVNQTLSRTLLTSFATWLVVIVLYIWGGEGVHLFAFVMVVGVIVGTYSSIYIASPLLLIFGEGRARTHVRDRQPAPQPEGALT